MNRLLRDKKAIAVFTVPTLFFFIILELVPIMISLGYTFYEGQPGVNFKFVGLNNYIRLLGDSRLRTVVGNNLVFTLGITAGQIIDRRAHV